MVSAPSDYRTVSPARLTHAEHNTSPPRSSQWDSARLGSGGNSSHRRRAGAHPAGTARLEGPGSRRRSLRRHRWSCCSGDGGLSTRPRPGPRYLINYRAPLDDGSSRGGAAPRLPTRRRPRRRWATSTPRCAEARTWCRPRSPRGSGSASGWPGSAWPRAPWRATARTSGCTSSRTSGRCRSRSSPAPGSVPCTARWRRSGRQDHQAGAGLSARTVRYVATIVNAALREAVEQGLLAANPADNAARPRREPRGRPKFTLGLGRSSPRSSLGVRSGL